MPAGFAELPPDLVIEELSPDDRRGDVLAKTADWLNAGVQRVWIVDPVRASARVYRADGAEAHLRPDDGLDDEELVPGFSCPLATIPADDALRRLAPAGHPSCFWWVTGSSRRQRAGFASARSELPRTRRTTGSRGIHSGCTPEPRKNPIAPSRSFSAKAIKPRQIGVG
ncbi:MAG: Uma2 family endonuclease [Gemmatimonadaceae bacterium]